MASSCEGRAQVETVPEVTQSKWVK